MMSDDLRQDAIANPNNTDRVDPIIDDMRNKTNDVINALGEPKDLVIQAAKKVGNDLSKLRNLLNKGNIH